MTQRIRIEIVGRNEFWRKAFFVEWRHQFPARELIEEADKFFSVETDWFDDLRRVAEQCFSNIRIAPANPSRRALFRRLTGGS